MGATDTSTSLTYGWHKHVIDFEQHSHSDLQMKMPCFVEHNLKGSTCFQNIRTHTLRTSKMKRSLMLTFYYPEDGQGQL